MTRFLKRDASLGFSVQADFVTEKTTGFAYLLCADAVEPDLAREIQMVDLLEGQVGVSSAPLAGSKHGGTVKFKIPMQGLAVAYDPTADTITAKVPGIFTLLCAMLGCDTANAPFSQSYGAAHVDAGCTTTSIVTTAGTHVVGGFIATEKVADSTNVLAGWIKSKAGAPETLTLEEALAGTPAAGDAVVPSVTACLTAIQPIPQTLRYVGSVSQFGYIFIGCVCENVDLVFDVKGLAMVEVTYKYTDHKRSSSIGGLQVPTKYTRLQPIMGASGSRCTIDGALTTGIKSIKVSVAFKLAFMEDPNAGQGVQDCTVVDRKVKFSFVVPLNSSDTIVNGSGPWETKLENQTAISFMLTLGSKIGNLFSLYIPAARLAAQPKLVDMDGFWAESLELEAGPSQADKDPAVTDSAPADTPLRIGLA